MQISLAIFKQKYSAVHDVLAVLEDNGDHLLVTSPDDLSGVALDQKLVRKDAVEILPLSLISCEHKNEYRIEGSGADANLDVEIYLVGSDQDNDKYDIVRRYKGQDIVLGDEALSLSRSCNVLAACSAIDWQCLFTNTGDIETVCLSNAVAIVEEIEVA